MPRSFSAPAADARAQRALDVLDVQSERLATLVGTLLNVSRIQLGTFSLDRRPGDVRALTRRVVDETQPTLERHTVSCICPEGSLIVDGDAARLEQVAQNLLQNAIKFSRAGGSIAVTVSQMGEHAEESKSAFATLTHKKGRLCPTTVPKSDRISTPSPVAPCSRPTSKSTCRPTHARK